MLSLKNSRAPPILRICLPVHRFVHQRRQRQVFQRAAYRLEHGDFAIVAAPRHLARSKLVQVAADAGRREHAASKADNRSPDLVGASSVST